jgi:hypothetical protein
MSSSSSPPSDSQSTPTQKSVGGPRLPDVFEYRTRQSPRDLELCVQKWGGLDPSERDDVLRVDPEADLNEISIMCSDHPRFVDSCFHYLRNKSLIEMLHAGFRSAFSPDRPVGVRGVVNIDGKSLLETLAEDKVGAKANANHRESYTSKAYLYRFATILTFRFETCLKLKAGLAPYPERRGPADRTSSLWACCDRGALALTAAFLLVLIALCSLAYRLWLGISAPIKYDPFYKEL